MIYLGIDPAKSSGYALLDGPHGKDAVRLASGVIRFSERESYYRQIVRVLRGLPAAPEVVCIESPVLYFETDERGRKVPRNLMGYRTHAGIMALWIDAVFEVFHLRAEIVMPSEWQSSIFRGMGMGSTKAKSDRFCRQKYGYTPEDDNEADALCIAFWMHTRYGFTLRVTGDTPKDRIKAAINRSILRKGGDPMVLQILEEKEKKSQ